MRLAMILLLLFLTSVAYGQEKTPGWLSLKRVSLDFNTAYHFSPWDAYNDALGVVSRQINLSPFFLEPLGFYEKINGDFHWQLGLRYSLNNSFSATVHYQQAVTNSRFEFYTNPDYDPGEGYFRTVAFWQEIDFKLQSIGVGLGYERALFSGLKLYAEGGVNRYRGDIDMDWQHNRNTLHTGPLEPDEGEFLIGNMHQTDWGWHGTVGVGFQLIGPLIFKIAANYRKIEMKDFRGKGIDGYYGQSGPSETERGIALVQAANYFGVQALDALPEFGYYIFPPLTFLTEPGVADREPAKLDFSAIGIQTGITIGL